MARITGPGFFTLDQWMLQHLCQVRRKAEVIVVSHGLASQPPTNLLADPRANRRGSAGALPRQATARVRTSPSCPRAPTCCPTVCGRKLALGTAWLDDAA
jgi:hypothetical protein